MSTEEPRGSSRDGLIDAVLAFLSGGDLLSADEVRAALEHEIDGAGPDALLALKTRLGEDNGWGYYPRDPLAQRIHHLLAHRFLDEEAVRILERARALASASS